LQRIEGHHHHQWITTSLWDGITHEEPKKTLANVFLDKGQTHRTKDQHLVVVVGTRHSNRAKGMNTHERKGVGILLKIKCRSSGTPLNLLSRLDFLLPALIPLFEESKSCRRLLCFWGVFPASKMADAELERVAARIIAEEAGEEGEGTRRELASADKLNFINELFMRRLIYLPAPLDEITARRPDEQAKYRVVRTLVHTAAHFTNGLLATHYNELTPEAATHFQHFLFLAAIQGALLPSRALRGEVGGLEAPQEGPRAIVTIEPLFRTPQRRAARDGQAARVAVGFRYQLLAAQSVTSNVAVAALPPVPPAEEQRRGERSTRKRGRQPAPAAAPPAPSASDAIAALLHMEDVPPPPPPAAPEEPEEEEGAPAADDPPGQRRRIAGGDQGPEVPPPAPPIPVPAPADNFDRFLASLLAEADKERYRVQYAFDNMKARHQTKVFEKNPKQYSASYDYLRTRTAIGNARDFLTSYFVSTSSASAASLPSLALTSFLAVDEANGRPWRSFALGQEFQHLTHARHHAFSVRDAFSYHVVGGRKNDVPIDAQQYDMAQYYDSENGGRLEDRPMPPTTAVDDALDQQRIDYIQRPCDTFGDYFQQFTAFWGDEFARSGAPAPQRYPFPEFIYTLRGDCLRPELIMERPLPYRLGIESSAVELASTGGDVRRLCGPLHDMFVDAMCHRFAALGGLRQRVMNGINAHRAGLEPARADYIADDAPALEGLSTILAGSLERERAEDRDVDQRLRRRLAEEVDKIDDFAGLKQTSATAALDRGLHHFGDGLYPGLIDVAPQSADPRDQLRYEKNVSTFLIRLGSGEGAPTVAMGREAMERAALEQIAAGMAPAIDYGIPGLGRLGDEAFVGPMSETQELVEEALRVQSRSGRWSAVPEAIVRQDVAMQLRIINEAERIRIMEQNPVDGPERDHILAEATDRQVERSLNAFHTSTNTAPAIIGIRNSIARLSEDGHGLLMRRQPDVNDSNVMHQAMSYLLNTITGPFQLSQRTLSAVIAAYIAKFEALRMDEWASGRAPPNLFFGGPPAAGKSFTLNMTTLLALPGSTQDIGRMTGQSQTTGTSNAWVTRIMHEAAPAMFIDDNDAKKSGGKDRASGGDSQMHQTLKNMITDWVLTTLTMGYEDDTKKKRIPVIVQSLVYGIWMVACNWDYKAHSSAALLSRFILWEFKARVEDAGAATSFSGHYKPKSLDWSNEFFHLIREHHLIHGHASIAAWLCTTGAIPGGMLTDVAELLTMKVLEKLINEFNLPKANVGIRQKDHIVALACGFAAFRVAFTQMATPVGHLWLAKNEVSAYSAKAMARFAAPRMAVTVADTICAITLLDFQFDSREERDIFELLAGENFLNAHRSGASRQKPLKTYVNEMIGTTANVEHVIELEQAQRQAAIVAYQAAVARGEAVRQPPDPIGTGPRAVIEDHRYLTLQLPSFFVDTLADSLAIRQLQRLGYQNRKEAIIKAITRLETERITAPYLTRRSEDHNLCIIPGGDQRLEQIPIVIRLALPVESGGNGQQNQGRGKGGQGKSSSSTLFQLGISVEFLQSRIMMPITPDYLERMKADMIHRGLSPAEQDLYSARLRQTPLERLDVPEIRHDQVNEDWARRHSQPDFFRTPTALAIRSVLQTSTLGRMGRVVPGRTYDPVTEEQHVERYICFYAPRNVRIKDASTGHTVTLNLSHYLTVLDVPRATDYDTFMRVTNESRIGKTGQAQAGATLGSKGDPSPRSLLANLSRETSIVDGDLDYFISKARARLLGRPRDNFLRQLAKKAKIKSQETVTSIASDNRINRYLRGTLEDWPSDSFSYPADDILDDFERVTRNDRAIREKDFASMGSMAALYLGSDDERFDDDSDDDDEEEAPQPRARQEEEEEEQERRRRAEEEDEGLFGHHQ
jgi:hypothetical protein